jgi:2-keto-4-pentenoate hydratase/2-oxohepta-3-ene-1,7-dioic acid hydratase in catechol pathway
MRLVTYMTSDGSRWGEAADGMLWPQVRWPTLSQAITAGALEKSGGLPRDEEPIPLDRIRFAPVVDDPRKILCVGLNYENHRKETGRAEVAHPTIFTRFADSQIGHGADMVRPAESDRFDYEGELAVIIGKAGRRIPVATALDHAAGYSCYNDGSVRDWQAHTIQFTPGKTWPGTGAFGPWMVTPDEFGEPGPQRLQTRLNGVVMQEARLSDMIFSVQQIIAYVSTFTPLAPGDVIVSGTPGGVGAKRHPPVFMAPGDLVEVEIDGIGTLSNRIVQER